MAYWSISVRGSQLALGHLEPLKLECPCEPLKRSILIDVRFSVHCFTVQFDDVLHDDDVKIMDHKVPRAFDSERYDWSMKLPGMVALLPTAKVHQTPERRNYVYYGEAPLDDDRALQMFFRLSRASKRAQELGCDLEMFVESAYVADQLVKRKRPNSIRFSVLAYKILRGQPIRFAAR